METKTSAFDWYSAIQCFLSVLAALAALGLALVFLVSGLIELASRSTGEQPTQSFLMAGNSAFVGLLLAPSAIFSLLRLLGRPLERQLLPPRVHQVIMLALPLLVLPVVLLLGDWTVRTGTLTWLLLPVIHTLAVGIPVLWLINLGQYKLPELSHQRLWGVLAGGLVIGPFLLIILEILIGLGMVIFYALLLALQPGQIELLQELTQAAQTSGMDAQALTSLAMGYLQQPVVIYLIFTFMAVMVPLIEELLKPAGVWLLAGRRLTSDEGFAAGLVSGAGMALFESLGYGSLAGADWTVIVLARSGTAVMHIFTAGLMGWALASAWAERRYVRLGLVYLAAVLIHGLWNGLAIGSGLMNINNVVEGATANTSASAAQLWLVAVYGIVLLFGLIGFNTWLRRNLARQNTAVVPPDSAADVQNSVQ